LRVDGHQQYLEKATANEGRRRRTALGRHRRRALPHRIRDLLPGERAVHEHVSVEEEPSADLGHDRGAECCLDVAASRGILALAAAEVPVAVTTNVA
jgi:hypothetical protein